MIYLIVLYISLLISIVIAYIKKIEQLKRYRLEIKNYEDKFIILSNELQDIASLNKFCIERWEKAILDNQNISSTNRQLIELVHNLEFQLQKTK